MSQRPFHILGLQQIAITVNALLPGVTDTDMNAAWLHTPEAQKFAAEMSAFAAWGKQKTSRLPPHLLPHPRAAG
jgi:hypothetical protein